MRRAPKYFPHSGAYAYSCRGNGQFDPRVRRKLRNRGFRAQDIVWLENLYFYRGPAREHCTDTGFYINHPRCRLYSLSRRMKNDRKMPLVFLVVRSGLFEVDIDHQAHRVKWFRSPYARKAFGAIF